MFNISSVPAGQIISNSTLNVYIHASSGSTTGGCWQFTNRTWDEMDGVTTYLDMGAELDSYDSSSASVWRFCDVTSWVKAEYDAGARNVSIAINDSGSSFGNHWIVCKDNHTHTSTWPYLNITYSAGNTAPYIRDVNVTPHNATQIQDLNCSWYVQDEQDGSVLCNVTWFNTSHHTTAFDQTDINCSNASTCSVTTLVLNSSTVVGEKWKCNVTIWDSSDATNSSVYETMLTKHYAPTVAQIVASAAMTALLISYVLYRRRRRY